MQTYAKMFCITSYNYDNEKFELGNVFKLRCKNRKIFSKDAMSSIARTLLTRPHNTNCLIKQNMHILIPFHCNCPWFILTISPTSIQKKNNKLNALPIIYQSNWLGFCVLYKIKGTAMTSAMKCVYTGPIGVMRITNTI